MSPDAKKKVLIDDAALVEIFEQLAGQTEPRRVAFRFGRGLPESRTDRRT